MTQSSIEISIELALTYKQNKHKVKSKACTKSHSIVRRSILLSSQVRHPEELSLFITQLVIQICDPKGNCWLTFQTSFGVAVFITFQILTSILYSMVPLITTNFTDSGWLHESFDHLECGYTFSAIFRRPENKIKCCQRANNTWPGFGWHFKCI